MRISHCCFIAIVTLLLGGCSVTPKSSAGLYSNDINEQIIKGSNDQYRVTGTAMFSPGEVFEAAILSMNRLGYTIDARDSANMKVTGNYIDIDCNQTNPAVITMAVIIREKSKRPESSFYIFADRHNIACLGGSVATQTALKLKSEILKVLSTF